MTVTDTISMTSYLMLLNIFFRFVKRLYKHHIIHSQTVTRYMTAYTQTDSPGGGTEPGEVLYLHFYKPPCHITTLQWQEPEEELNNFFRRRSPTEIETSR